MLSVSLIKGYALLFSLSPVLCDFEKMTAANEPEKLKAALKFDSGHVYVDDDAKFLVEPEGNMFEFEFLTGCEKSVHFEFQSFKFTILKGSLIEKQDRRTVTVSSTGKIGGTLTSDVQSGKFLLENGRVLLHIVFNDKCRLELVKGTPLLDDAESQLIGGLTPLQFALAIVLPVVGAVVIAFSIFAIYKKVKSWQKKQEKQKLKMGEKNKAEKETANQKEEEEKSAEAERDQEKEEKKMKKKPKEDSLQNSRRRIHSEKESAVGPCAQPTLEEKVRDENAAKHKLQVDKLCAVITAAMSKIKEKQLEKEAAPSRSKQDKLKLAELDLELEKVKASLKASIKQKEKAEKNLKKVKKQMAVAERKRKSLKKPKAGGPTHDVNEQEFEFSRSRVKDLVERQRPVVTPLVNLKTAVEEEEPKASALKTAEEKVEKVKKAATLKTAEEKVETARAKTRTRTKTVSCGQDEDLKVIDDDWETDMAKKKTAEGKEDDMVVLDDDYEGDMAKKAAARKKKSRTLTDPSCCAPEDDMAVLDEDWQTAKKRRASRNTSAATVTKKSKTKTETSCGAPEDDMAVLDEDWKTAKKRKVSPATKTTTKGTTGTVMGQTLSATLPDNSQERQKWRTEREKAAALDCSGFKN